MFLKSSSYFYRSDINFFLVWSVTSLKKSDYTLIFISINMLSMHESTCMFTYNLSYTFSEFTTLAGMLHFRNLTSTQGFKQPTNQQPVFCLSSQIRIFVIHEAFLLQVDISHKHFTTKMFWNKKYFLKYLGEGRRKGGSWKTTNFSTQVSSINTSCVRLDPVGQSQPLGLKASLH